MVRRNDRLTFLSRNMVRPLTSVPVPVLVATKRIGVPTYRRLDNDVRRYWNSGAWCVDLLAALTRNVMRPLAAVPIAAFVAAEWVGIPVRGSLVRLAPRLTASIGRGGKNSPSFSGRASRWRSSK